VNATLLACNRVLQLKENVAAFEVELDKETLDAIDEIHLRRRNPQSTD